jgi:ABC-type branched-subunit amino acid transport system substrate-binding protein
MALLSGCRPEASNPTNPAGDQAAPTAARQAEATKAPIRIMTIGSWTQPQLGTSNPEFPAGALAAAAAINRSGGIGGREVEVIVCSDELNPEVARQCVRKAIDKGVVAVVGLQTFNETTILPILEAKGIPAIGVYPFTRVGLTNPVSFPDSPGFIGQTIGMGLQLAEVKAPLVRVVVPGGMGSVSSELSDSVRMGVVAGRTAFGGLVQIPAKSLDLSPVVVAATEDNASVAGLAVDQAGFIRTMRILAPRVNVTTFPFNLTPDVLRSAGAYAEGVMSVEGFVPPSAETPGTKQFRADLRQFDSAMKPSATGLHEWLAVQTFAKVARSLDVVSALKMSAAMNGVRDLDMGGITPPYSSISRDPRFPRLFNSNVVFEVVRNGEIVLQHQNGSPFVDIGYILKQKAN